MMEQQFVALLNIPLTFQFGGKDTKNEEKMADYKLFKRESKKLSVLNN